MIFSEKLQILRKSSGLTQEELAEKLNISRQAVAKWESGRAYPDIDNLIQISTLFHLSIDYLVKDQECSLDLQNTNLTKDALTELMDFRLEANRNTYAACTNEFPSTRLDSHDFRYERDGYTYHDTYIGTKIFTGEEAVWKDGVALYGMNYLGRVLSESFSGSFLKEALRAADRKMPYRGPEYYEAGEYVYRAKVTGDFSWFQGYEEILFHEEKVYECFFHGGLVK